jgi:hypothetical protein
MLGWNLCVHWYMFCPFRTKFDMNFLFSSVAYYLFLILNVQINNNLRCYELSLELSSSTLEALPQNYAEQVPICVKACRNQFCYFCLVVNNDSCHLKTIRRWETVRSARNSSA